MYMVDEALYKDILLAVAAMGQNQWMLTDACSKLEAHMVQIEDSHERIRNKEKEEINQFVRSLTEIERMLHQCF
jgi:hypothetical protein